MMWPCDVVMGVELEVFAMEFYRSAILTLAGGPLLDMSRFEFGALLSVDTLESTEHGYDVEDLKQDLATREQIEAKGRMPQP